MRFVATPVTAEVFAPFGALVMPPERPGERNSYTHWLATDSLATARLHVNFVPESRFPHTVTMLEKHPHTVQIFLPLEASGYLIVVAPSQTDGTPDLTGVRAFVAPGNVGVLYAANTWHAGATALHGKAHFAVYMHRNGVDDDVFLPLSAELIVTL